MKYLKTFESSSDDYYHEITDVEWNKLSKRSLRFTEGEFQKIRKLIKHYLDLEIVDLGMYNYISCGNRFEINKLDDEWYIVYSHEDERSYKCDQWEGLLKYIQDNNYEAS